MERVASKDQCQKATSDQVHSSNFTQTVEYHLLHLSMAKQDEDRIKEGQVYSNLGLAYYSVGEFRKAVEYHQLHLAIGKEVGEREGG